jgi:subtilisin family serine protease
MISNRLAKADPRLTDLIPVAKAASGFSGAAYGQEAPTIDLIVVLNRHEPPEKFKKLRWDRVAPGMFTVRIAENQFDDLIACSEVENVYGSEPIRLATTSTLDDPMNKASLRGDGDHLFYTGEGSVIGIIDYGFDLTHPDFIKDGKTRVAWYWDQTQQGTQTTFRYGVEFDEKTINDALSRGRERAFDTLGKPPLDAHGTHVAGIAAGNGLSMKDSESYDGMAPDATLIFVNLRQESDGFTKDSNVVQALEYIFNKAETAFEDEREVLSNFIQRLNPPKRKRPCVVNLSISKNDGGHDGSSVIEQTIDRLLQGEAGRAVVVAAGNSGGEKLHAEWQYTAGESLELQWIIPDVPQETRPPVYYLEAWYSSRDEITAQLVSPPGEVSAVISPGLENEKMIGTTSTRIQSTRFLKPECDSRIFIRLRQPVLAGPWIVRLTAAGDTGGGTLHAWIDNTPEKSARARFGSFTRQTCTLGNPATSRFCISVGNVDHRETPMIVVSSSSRGRTRDGREKPEVIAPGTNILSSCALGGIEGGAEMHSEDSGTSMSAPHVTGLIACLFQEHAGLTATQIQKVLIAAAAGSSSALNSGHRLRRTGHGRHRQRRSSDRRRHRPE